GSCPIADHRVEFVVRTQTLRRRRETRIAEQVRSPDRLDHVRPVAVVTHAQRHPRVVRSGRMDTLYMTAATISLARPRDGVHRVFDDRLGGNAGRNLDLSYLDELSFAGAASMLERREKGDPCVHPDDRLGGVLLDA